MNEDIKTKMGMNKTGIAMSPIDAAEAAEGAERLTVPPEGPVNGILNNRILYMKESGPVGTVPLPANTKGVLSSLQGKLMHGSHSLLDKLGERLAFERTGVRLYEGLLAKYQGASDKSHLPPLDLLEKFHREELLHFYMLQDVIKSIGGDPTAVTPAADIAAVASMGWTKVVSDPRTNFTQTLEVILQAELVDNDGWDMLIKLTSSAGLREISEQFEKARREEDEHLSHVRAWMNSLLMQGEAKSLSKQ